MSTAADCPTTKRYPRTLEEAFGPYCRGPISEPKGERMDPRDKPVIWACAVVAVALLAMAALSWI